MNRIAFATAILLLATACSRQPAQQPPEQPTQRSAAPAASTNAPAPPAPSPAPAPVPTARQPTVDPKSSEAAEELVQAFARLVNAGRLDQAYMLLGANAQPRPAFDRDFERFRDLRVTVGAAGRQDGAAGSIYVSVPLTVTGTDEGKHVSRSATAVLRRINDVPGSTEAQRHWHIERIDWNDGR